jgi:oligopeptide/dipeptide ABC transporter ATP-binding protein
MREKDTSLLLITHNMSVVWEMCDRVAVMYASELVECAPRDRIFRSPRHPYTAALIRSIPSLDSTQARLDTIPGQVPSALHYPAGCRFRERCAQAFDRCATEHPPLYEMDGCLSRCFLCDPERRTSP